MVIICMCCLQVFETVEPCIKKNPDLINVLERLVEPVRYFSLSGAAVQSSAEKLLFLSISAAWAFKQNWSFRKPSLTL